MKKFTRISLFGMILVVFVLSACGAAAPALESAASGGKVQAAAVEFTGMIEAINGNQWTINGQVITVDPSVIKDGPFQVGDTVKLEADVAEDGTVTVTRVELPAAAPADINSNESAANDNSSAATNSNSNTNANSNESTPATDGSLVFDDSGNEAFGAVESITTDSVVIGGQTFALTNSTEFKGLIEAGAFVKVHLALNADGSYTITEIELWDPSAVSSGNSNSNSNSSLVNGNSNDDNSNGNSNDDDDDDDDNGNGNSNDDDDDDDDNSNGGSNGNGNGNG